MNDRSSKRKLFVALLTRSGARMRAARIFSEAMQMVLQKLGLKSVATEEVLSIAIENMKLRVRMGTRRVGGVDYNVPVTVSEKGGETAAVRAIVASARTSKGGPMSWRLAKALLAAVRRQVSPN